MKKGYYFAQDGLYTDASVGVGKKIHYQIETLKKYEIDCSFVPVPVFHKSKSGNKILSRLPFGRLYDWAVIEKAKDSDFIYIRKTKIDYHLYRAIKAVKEKGKAKVLFEIPTYPYYREFLGFDKVYLLKDMIWRKKVLDIVDKVFLYGTPDEELQCQYTALRNAINVDEIKPKGHSDNNLNEINLVSVSTMCFWHGYDRLIEGLKEYYETNPSIRINVHMVGYGPEEEKYKKMVSDYNLTEYFTFYGRRSGKELDDIYDRVDIGLEGFGFHRKGLLSSTSLKSLEYGAKGIPFVSSTPNDNFDSSEFICLFEANETPINILKIIDFYNLLIEQYQSKDLLRDSIRTYTKEYCSFDVALKPITDFINEEE